MGCGGAGHSLKFYVLLVLFVLLLTQYVLELRAKESAVVVERSREGAAAPGRSVPVEGAKEKRPAESVKVPAVESAEVPAENAEVAVTAHNTCLTRNRSIADDLIKEHGDWKRILRMKSTGFHSFNATASDLLGKHREGLRDTRYAECKNITYDICKLPTTSVIIVFHNEAWSTLLRSVHSILERTPPSLIMEIILVDDCSSFEWLKEPLTDYIRHLPKVTLIRFKIRRGLIQARLRGAAAAKGQVLYFTDAHTETNVGWLEPLLARIVEDRKVVVVPYIDPINWKNMNYQRVAADYHGAFNWNMEYFYKVVPEHILHNKRKITDPIPSPTMIGCAHAVERNYFYESGAYDESMEIWGGENLEHAFRLWMCGGRVEVIPCSKIGHVFKPQLPYGFGDDSLKVIQRNMIRLAEVWMDDYKKYYYATQDRLAPVDVRSIFERKKLREKLNCKSFDWYMKTVIPEMPIPSDDAKWFGKILWWDDPLFCLTTNHQNHTLEQVMCEAQEWKEVTFTITEEGHFKLGEHCIGVSGSRLSTGLECDSAVSTWDHDAKSHLIYLMDRDECLQYEPDTKHIRLAPCSAGNLNQQWQFEMNFHFGVLHNAMKSSIEHSTIPLNALRFGQLVNVPEQYCLHVLGFEYNMIPCSEQPSFFHAIHLDIDRRLMYEDSCFTMSESRALKLNKCDQLNESQKVWEYHVDTLHLSATLNNNSSLCLTFNQHTADNVFFADCDNANLFQAWTI